ncbi:hypothetical protein TWF788_008612 [Orbilia oligospora]|uniref:Uncharacterized protein n=1 Tax=Orbilia oligospora TaxID=2813651 RepID=A0A7C8PJA3_ORBOL|nr:hypothetical protein TWF788_008612 [Orbilia oligospora]
MPFPQTPYTYTAHLLTTLLLLTLTFHPTPTTAYYQLASRSKRGEWFGNFPNYTAGSRMGDNKVNKCISYTNTSDRGAVIAVTIYNQPGLGTSAPVFAFYEDTVCGGKGSGARNPTFVAVLDKPFAGGEEGEEVYYNPDDVDGVWLINLLQATGKEPTFKTMKALDYASELHPKGLLAGTENDPAQVIYKWNNKGVRERNYITGSVVKIEEPGGIIEKLTTSSDMYMAIRDLTERALRPGSENIPNPLPKYFQQVANGEVARGLTAPYLGEAIDSEADIRRKKIEMRRRSKQQRIENPQGIKNILSAIEKEQGDMSDTSVQVELEDFLASLDDDEPESRIEEPKPQIQEPEPRIEVPGPRVDIQGPESGFGGSDQLRKELELEPAATTLDQSNIIQQEAQPAVEEFEGDLYMDVIGANVPAEKQLIEVEYGRSETPDEQRLVKAAEPIDDLDSQDSRNSARARAFQQFMEKAASIQSEPDQQGTETIPLIKTEWELGDPVAPVSLRIRPDGVSIVPNPKNQKVPITRPSQKSRSQPEDPIVISSDGSVAGEELRAADAMEIEEEIVQDAQTGQILPQAIIEEQVQEQVQEQIQEQVQEQIPQPQNPNINQEEFPIERIAAVDAIEEEEPLALQDIQQSIQPQPQSEQFPPPQARTLESGESSRSASRFRESMMGFQPEPFMRRSSTSTGRRPRSSRQSEQSLQRASFDDIENPPPGSIPNSNDRIALESFLEQEDQLPGREGSFENYEGFVAGRRRGSGSPPT